ncbi:hypothetical protein [Streptomyces sp. BRA346]|uniref:hypothetical protein n=1 Tax=Streptomyces sp. BRA346 TaxID=2878199 RepID=UPI004063EFFD
MRYGRKTARCIAAGALATGMLTLSAGTALAERNQTALPEQTTAVAGAMAATHGRPAVAAEGYSRPDAAGTSVHVMARIPWDKSGRDKVPKCARHGKLNTSGVTDHLKLINRCSHSVTYHVILDKHSDYWRKVPSGYYWTSSWKWPAKLHKIGT